MHDEWMCVCVVPSVTAVLPCTLINPVLCNSRKHFDKAVGGGDYVHFYYTIHSEHALLLIRQLQYLPASCTDHGS